VNKNTTQKTGAGNITAAQTEATINSIVEDVYRQAEENYSTWGQWIVETTTKAEAAEQIRLQGTGEFLIKAAKLQREREEDACSEIL
jgi:hypothetical protein